MNTMRVRAAGMIGMWMLMMSAGASAAPFIDDLSTNGNFTAGFNGTTAVSNGSTVTITRNAGGDAGIDWRPGGTGFFDTGAYQWQAEVLPVAPGAGGDFYDINILFFTAANDGAFSSEVDWVSTASVALQTVDVRTFAGATQFYYLRFRIQPDAGAGPSFEFNELRAVPEPSGLIAGLVGFAVIALKRRGRPRRA